MAIKQTITTPINQSPNGVAAIVNEAADGTKVVISELAMKKADNSGFEQVSESRPLPVQVVSGSFVRQSTAPRPTGKEGDSLYLWDTKQAFVHDGTQWREV